MAELYENFDGHEAAQVLAESFGILQTPQTKQQLPRLVECPNVTCKELNTPDAPFCAKCRVPLIVVGYMEQGHQKEREKRRSESARSILITFSSNRNVIVVILLLWSV